MNFITSQQANIQGCKIETPHSQDIRDICGTSMCADTRENLLDGLVFDLGTAWVDDGRGQYSHPPNVTGSTDTLSTIVPGVTQNGTYELHYTVTEVTGSGIRTLLSGLVGAIRATTGSFVDTIGPVGANQALQIQCFVNASGKINSIALYDVTP